MSTQVMLKLSIMELMKISTIEPTSKRSRSVASASSVLDYDKTNTRDTDYEFDWSVRASESEAASAENSSASQSEMEEESSLETEESEASSSSSSNDEENDIMMTHLLTQKQSLKTASQRVLMRNHLVAAHSLKMSLLHKIATQKATIMKGIRIT